MKDMLYGRLDSEVRVPGRANPAGREGAVEWVYSLVALIGTVALAVLLVVAETPLQRMAARLKRRDRILGLVLLGAAAFVGTLLGTLPQGDSSSGEAAERRATSTSAAAPSSTPPGAARETGGVRAAYPDDTTVISRQVDFSWPSTYGATSYDINIRADPDIGEEGGFIWGTVTQNSASYDLGFINRVYVGTRFYWGTRPVFADKTRGAWTPPSTFIYSPPSATLPPLSAPVPTPPVSARDVLVAVSVSPARPVADGTSLVLVTATLRTKTGKAVAGANVRFVLQGYSYRNGTVYGGNDELQVGAPYEGVASGGYVMPDGLLSNLIDALSDQGGTAVVRYRVPAWNYFMGSKPVALGAWYDVDGGGNPYAEKLVYFGRPQ